MRFFKEQHSFKLAALVGRQHPIVFKFLRLFILLFVIPLRFLRQFILYAYSFITPPCFYSPGNEFHVSLDDQIEAIAITLEHKQKKMIKQRHGKRFKLLLISFALLLLAFKHHSNANAGSSNANLGVSATVTGNCKLTSSTMAFGTYDGTSGSHLDVTGYVGVRCTKNTSVSIGMNTGTHAPQAIGTSRSMQNTSGGSSPADFMSYELYKNVGRTSVWNTSSPLTMTATTSNEVAVPIYGRIPQGQNVQTGGYLDTIIVTVNF